MPASARELPYNAVDPGKTRGRAHGAAPMVAEAHARSGPWRIFLVEDHVDTARAISLYLRGHGHVVHVAHDVETARRSAGEAEFDILLSDLGLPDGNGWDLLRELQRDRSFKAVAMSGYNSAQDLARSKAAGFLEHLAKPLVPEDLEAAFHRVMGNAAR